jgi:hypothetical protein
MINWIRIAKYIFFISLILISLIYLFTPSRDQIVKQLEAKGLPTPIFADREHLIDILNLN